MQETRGRAAAPIAAQLVAVWLLGAVAIPMGFGLVAVAVFAGSEAMLLAVLVAAALAIGYLWLVIRFTAPVSLLGATAPRRALWALLVFGGGTAMWGAGWALTDEAGLGISHHTVLTLIFGGVPFVLVAGVLLRRWYLSLTALVVLLGLVATGLVALRQSGPDELTERLDHARLSRDMAYVVEVPGYRPVDTAYGDRLGTGLFLPEDPAALPPDRFITVVAYQTTLRQAGVCGPTALDSVLATAECTVEPDGLVYRLGVVHHGYQVSRGDLAVVVAGTLGVDRQQLRDAVRTLRPATAAERGDLDSGTPLFAVDLPGYRGERTGIPTGTMYQPTDRTGSGSLSVHVHLTVYPAFADDYCAFAECAIESDGATYVRRDDTHGYVIRYGEVHVHVTGGLRVDRAFLRQVAHAARPATDAELLRALPPPPATGPLDILRRRLR